MTALFFALSPVRAEEHHATRLGNPATRFAPPLHTAEDLRARFRDPKLKPDFAEVLRQWGWKGNLSDLFYAATNNEIMEVEIRVGVTMPFMSTRENGRPLCLRNVHWEGEEPIPAYAFDFISNGRRCRCVTPKPCSNFFVEDLGPELKPLLELSCAAREKIPVGRNAKICLTLDNNGHAAESNISLTLPIAPGSTVSNITAGGPVSGDHLVWQIPTLASKTFFEGCAEFVAPPMGTLAYQPTATGAHGKAECSCSTTVFGISAILLEKADDPDPVPMGSNTTYTVNVTNQGSADDSNVQVVVMIAPELVPVSSSEGTIDGQIVTFPLVPKLAAKQAVTYTIIAKGVQVGDGHTKFTLSSDILKSSIDAEESTTVY